MYKYEIKNLYSQKRESYRMIMSELINIYIKLKIGYPNLKQEKNNIKYLIKLYSYYDRNESDILKEINKRFGNSKYNIVIEDILDELDIIYNYYYNYIENIINNYELVSGKNIIDIIIKRINGKYINSDKFKYRLTLPVIHKSLDKEKILKKIRSI